MTPNTVDMSLGINGFVSHFQSDLQIKYSGAFTQLSSADRVTTVCCVSIRPPGCGKVEPSKQQRVRTGRAHIGSCRNPLGGLSMAQCPLPSGERVGFMLDSGWPGCGSGLWPSPQLFLVHTALWSCLPRLAQVFT